MGRLPEQSYKVHQESKTEAGKWPPFSSFSETGLVLLYVACKC